MKIESQTNLKEDCLKVIYQGKHGKLFPVDGLTYDGFVKRLEQVYKLPPVHSNRYHHLYFIDSEKDNITIRCQEDFATFLALPGKKKLYLIHTSDQDLHFQQQPPQKQKPIMNQAEIDRIISEKRQQLLSKIKHRLSALKQSLRKQIQMQMDKNRVITVHEGIKCQQCDNGKSITGTRYQCTICSYNICEDCEQNNDHPHPLFKILIQSQFVSVKKNKMLLDQNVKSYANTKTIKLVEAPFANKKKQMPQFYERFKTITNLSDEKAQAIILSRPEMSLQLLIQYFFTTQ